MTEALSPTKERIAKSRNWDHPEKSQNTDREASRVVDDVTKAWRDGDLEFSHYQAWEMFYRHWEGAQKHDVRVTDTTSDPSGSSERMPPWQFHGMKLAQARSALNPRQFQMLELMCMGWGFLEIGLHFSPRYKTRQQAMPYAFGKVEEALETLAFAWSLKLKEKIPR